MDPRRWTPLTFLVPSRYVDRDDFWDEFDLEEWSDEIYHWLQDDWNGLSDFATPPRETVDKGEGDCEDYALVAISWAVANDREGVGIGFCWRFPWPIPRHVIAFDDERVYSSGDVEETTVDAWVADSEYDHSVRRDVN